LTQAPRQGRTARSPAVATFLSFLWPGLGQLYSGARRSALLFGLPLLVVLFVVGLQALGGPENLLIELLTPSTALTVLILIVLLGAWRLISMADALGSAGRGGTWRRPVPLASFLILAVVVVTTHLAAANLAWSFYDAGKQIFAGVTDPDIAPAASIAAGASASAPALGQPVPTPTPPATPAPARINILLTGIDSGENRTHALNDTLLVVSLDPATGALAMVSFPRDMARLPTPDGTTFAGKINSLMSYADGHPNQYPQGGMAALTTEIGYLLGAKVDYYASVDLDGFSKLIDRVGGVTVNVTEAIDDPAYGGWKQPGRIGFRLSTGRHDLNGEEALAYVRSRKTIGDSDFGRARRQQQLLVALQRKLIDPAMLPNLPGILKDATQTLKTNFPPDRLSEMLGLARKTDEAAIKRYVLGPPYTVHPTNVTSTYILVPDMARIAKLSIALFGADSRYATTSPG
jgi:LCP family protein required for cell wall assembly